MKISNIKLSIFEDESLLKAKAAKIAGIAEKEIKVLKIVKKSIDARHKNDISYIYSVDINPEPKAKKLYSEISCGKTVVIGAGPCGLFCALELAKYGMRPIVIERGEPVEKRAVTVENFFSGGPLNTDSNVQFGEGGAGTFSDGKLNTQVNNELIGRVLDIFTEHGAPSEIQYQSKPHIGSDKLKAVVKNLRQSIIELGGSFMFSTKAEGFKYKNGKVVAVVTSIGEIEAENIVLAIGHSARDTFEALFSQGVFMEQKEFAVGFRVEQNRNVIDEAQYGSQYKKLPPSTYKLVSHAAERGVFTFCTCPGGEVVAACSEKGMLAVNGMSNFDRNAENTNSAVVCQVKKEDFSSLNPLSGIELQRKIESAAFNAGSNYLAPVQLAEDFLAGRKTIKLQNVKPSYRRGYYFSELDGFFPNSIVNSLRVGLRDMGQKLKGLASFGAVLTGVETRTSSPLRITRNLNGESVSHKNLYPCGEGCGYAGGIMSAAVDGLKTANLIASKYLTRE